MSKGSWLRCPHTGVPLNRIARVSEEYLSPEGHFNVDKLPDCNLFDVRSIADAGGFRDHYYFRNSVLPRANCPIHVRRQVLVDDVSGDPVVEIIATHQNSAQAGGRLWHEMQRALAQERVIAFGANISSGP